jgi:TonB family protein
MRAGSSILLALELALVATAAGQEAPKPIEAAGFVMGVDTYFDFGPPFHYYEIFVVTPAAEGTKVEKFTLTPPAHKCYAPEKTEYVEKTTTLSVKELLADVDPCRISDKDLKKGQKRRKKGLNYSGANISLQVSCAGATRTIATRVLEHDWFPAHPSTPANTGWTMQLLEKLRTFTWPGVMEKPIFDLTDPGPPTALSADPVGLENLKSGKYDSLFPGADETASTIYLASLLPRPQPSVTLLSSTPVEPVQFTLPAYPRLAWIAAHEGEPSVVVLLDSQGNVSSVEMVTGLFGGVVRDAVKDWKFPPAPPTTDILDPLREVTIRFSFHLKCNAAAETK